MNKKQLYESIMVSVAKEVKKVLNENLDIPNYKEIIDIIKSTDWDQQFEDKTYDYNLNIYGGKFWIDIPDTDELALYFDVEFKWHYIGYTSATRYQPAEGGYNELTEFKVKNVELHNYYGLLMELPELTEYIHDAFSDIITQLAEDIMYNSDENNYDLYDD